MNYIIEFGEGCHGILPNDNMEYSVSKGRIIVYKDGEKIVDKTITNCPSGKCSINCVDNQLPTIDVVPIDGEVINKTDAIPGDPVLGSNKECKEYNVGTMLPQGMGVAGVPNTSRSPLMMAEDDDSEEDDINNPETESTNNNVDEVLFVELTLSESAINYINDIDGPVDVTESAKDVILNFATKVNVHRRIRVLIIEITLLQARLNVMNALKGKASKIAEIKKEIIAKEKEKRDLLDGQTDEVKHAVKKLEKEAIKEAKKEVSKDKEVKESSDDNTKSPDEERLEKLEEEYHLYGGKKDETPENRAYKHQLLNQIKSLKNKISDSSVNESVEEEPLTVKILRDKIDANEKRLKNAYDERQKYPSLINQLNKDNEEYEDSIQLILADKGMHKQEPIEECFGDTEDEPETVGEAVTPEVVFGASALASLAIYSIHKAIKKYQAYKRNKKYNEENDAMKAYVVKHPDAPRLSDFTRKKYYVNADTFKRDKIAPDVAGAAKGIYQYVYLYKGKEAVIVQEVYNRFASGTAKDFPKAIKKHEEYVYALILLYKHNWINDRISKFLEKEIKENKELKKKYHGKLTSDDQLKNIKLEKSIDNYRDILSSFVNEAANIDKPIKDIISELNAKGYHTRYSSAGHLNLRKKEDREPDGVYKGKLYTDARVQFKGSYKFGAAPKYWFWKKVDGDDYLDVIPITYKESDGTPDEAFAKWRDNYLGTLERWVSALPNASSNDNKDATPIDSNVKEESDRLSLRIDNYVDSIFRENGIR